jgi:hypothetical protein
MRTKTAVLTATLLLATLPLAATAGGVTIGGNVGSARVNEGDFQGNDTGWKVTIGSNYREVIGGEIGFVNFGTLGGSNNGPDAQAWAPALTLGVPVGLARLYAKGGVAFAEERHSSLREDSKNNDPFYGAGIGIGITQHLGFRAEYERYKLTQEKVDMAMAGLEFRF